jgi:putative DNA primase/helicase
MLSFVRGVESRDVWVKMAYVLRDEFGDLAFDAWDQWSQGAPNYNARDARDVWKSCRSGTGSARAGIGTLIALAKEGGWRATTQDRKPVDPAELQRMAADRAARLEADRLAAEQDRATCAAVAAEAWSRAIEGDHPYTTRKLITTEGARVLDGDLLIPMRHGPGALVGLQRIKPDGTKLFLKGTPATGAYTVLGKPGKHGPVVICEGWATGKSIQAATGYCVVVAFNASNLQPVAEKIRRALPEAALIIGADDDFETGERTGKNTGLVAADEAACAVSALIAVPLWIDDRGRGTDFNDLHAAEGLDAVRQCFEDPKPPGGEPEPEPDTIPQDHADSAWPASAENPASGSVGALPSPAAVASSSGERTEFTKEEKLAYALKKHEEKQLAKTGGPLVDYYGWLPNVNDKGKPLSTIENLGEVCRRLNITIRYNVISKEEEILIPGAGFSIDNRQNASLSWLISECAKFRMPVDRVPDFVTYLADRNQYNPVATWITSRPWDGQDHLSQLIATVRAKGEAADHRVGAMKTAFITRWMISAVAAAFRSTGVSAHGVLVFQGPQYIGKTKWFKTLVPASLGLLKDGMLLRPDDRDSVMKCVSNWLVELGEIDATFRKSDVAALKSFLTSDCDVLRRAYARKESSYARRTVFFASVNPKNYLHDETGNRRYWTIECEHLDHSHTVNMQQCWAQVYEQLYLPGESWFLTPDELDMLNTHNEEFTVIDPIEDLITRNLRWNDPDHQWRWTTATDILVTLGRQNCSKAEVTKAGIILRKLNGDRSKRTGNARLLLVPDAYRDTLHGGVTNATY